MPDSRLSAAIIPVIGSFVGVVVGAFVSFAGVRTSVDGQLRQQDRQFQEARALEASKTRADTYNGFLNAADAFANASFRVARTLTCNAGKCAITPDARTTEEWGAWMTARYNYQGAINAVYTYGSDAAFEKSRAVSASLPRSLVSAGEELAELDQVDATSFRRAYQDFLTLVCREVPPTPRAGC